MKQTRNIIGIISYPSYLKIHRLLEIPVSSAVQGNVFFFTYDTYIYIPKTSSLIPELSTRELICLCGTAELELLCLNYLLLRLRVKLPRDSSNVRLKNIARKKVNFELLPFSFPLSYHSPFLLWRVMVSIGT